MNKRTSHIGNCEDRPIEDVIGNVTFRKIVKDDREKIGHILLDVRNFTQDEVRVALSLIDEHFKGDEDYNFTIATFESEVIGYVCYGPAPMTSGTWNIYWIAVLKEFQRNRIGTLLIKEVENEIRMREGRLILIETSSKGSYDSTREFYERMDYGIVSRIDEFYSEQDDKVIYGKYLEQSSSRV